MDIATKAEIRYHRTQLTAQLSTINTMIEKINDNLIILLSEKPHPTLGKIGAGLLNIETVRRELQLELSNAAAHIACIVLLNRKDKAPKPTQEPTPEPEAKQ